MRTPTHGDPLWRFAHPVLRLGLCLLLGACSLPAAIGAGPALVLVTPDPNASLTPTPFQPVAATLEPPTPVPSGTSPPATLTPLPTLESTATSPASPTAPAASDRTHYTIYALLDYAAHELGADETIRYTNRTGFALGELVLAVRPNARSGFTLENLLRDGAPLDYSLDGQRLTVYLPEALQPGAGLTLTMRFRISLPAKLREHPYGYDVDQLNLTDWYPFVVPYVLGQGWVLHEPAAVGEHLVYEAADFEVHLRATDPGVVLATSGVADPEPAGEWTRYRLEGARTFAVSASDQFQLYEAAAGAAGAQVRAYYYPGYETQGAAILNAAVRAVGLFEAKFGPYPYGSLSIVQADLNDGQEYDGLVYLATKFYNEYDGSARSNLVAIGVHEIAHQWWFGLVGSDPALEPWLDEALCVYSEAIFYQLIYPNSADWWWNFRVNYFGPSGYVDSTVYEAPTFRAYVNASYLNGANFLEALHLRMGDEPFYRFLQEYAARHGRGHATTADFFALARQHTPADISDLIAAYFRGDY